MKKIVPILFFFAGFLFSCQSKPKAPPAAAPAGDSGVPGPTPANPLESDTLIARNTGIDSAHAYSDLYLDTAELDQFISLQHLNDTLALELHNFYNARNFQYAWFDQDGLSEQALAFSSLYQYSKDSSTGRKWLDRELDILQAGDTSGQKLNAIDPTLQRTELLMTWRFMNFLNDRYPDKRQRHAAYLQLVPMEKRDPVEMARADISQSGSGVAGPGYQALVQRLKQFLDWQEKGGWGRLPKTHKGYRPGERGSFIAAVKKRLQLTGELAATDTTDVFDKDLAVAVKAYQRTHGLNPDGHIGPEVIASLNVPVEARIRQMLVNLERMRWQPADSTRRILIVNIPEFRLRVLDGGRAALTMNVVVGKEGHSTVLFSGRLNRIIFNPYWNIPRSIVRKEIVPAMEKNKDYLEAHDMEETGEEDGLPVIRQRPGEKNELGRIKFLFPNSFNIYLHDTPHKDLFNRTRRAYSHGCIRVADARGLAEYLLQDMPDWSKEKIDEVIAEDRERGVALKDPIPVLIVYYTAWVDEEGNLQFREDIYGHDSAVAQHLFLR
ncbi:MAG TPA: L,D-transpeptidase family protein [Puia sp.]|uniref:L,D-transpeptidase family protein n=1 Tax=Puia sp. TaxID=2045100 RepID=UPI002C50FF20|nr:L,D-transpeptidase family protein [Puia sp.]HVU98070.1 L,D-transpeptidase family protein [Puia sp.]